MQSSTYWHLQDAVARYAAQGLSVSVDLAHPASGGQAIEFREANLSQAALFSLLLPPEFAVGMLEPNDCYLRGEDVIATYEESEQCPHRLQLYYRGGWAALETNPEICGFDFQISLQTRRLDSNPQTVVHSRWPVQETRILDESDQRFEPLVQNVRETSLIPSGACILLRNEFGSIALFAHPNDYRDCRLRYKEGQMIVSHELFPPFLEKGVILRARLRMAALPAEEDEAEAFRIYQEFLQMELPLTT